MVDLQELFVIVTGELAAQIVQKGHMLLGLQQQPVLHVLQVNLYLEQETLSVMIVL